MARIVLRRHEMSLSSNTIGTDALNALLSIPGVSEPEVVEESEEHAVVSYTWVAGAVARSVPKTQRSANVRLGASRVDSPGRKV